MKEYYDLNEIRKQHDKGKIFLNKTMDDFIFKLKLFNRLNGIYFSRTPESDSLYRRRNRLIILSLTIVFYYKTSNEIFNRIELKLLSQRSLFKKLYIPLMRCGYFICCVFVSQLVVKYGYYLNKVYKSYQFALEGVLKYNIIEKNYTYSNILRNGSKFDIIDSENIKKNQ